MYILHIYPSNSFLQCIFCIFIHLIHFYSVCIFCIFIHLINFYSVYLHIYPSNSFLQCIFCIFIHLIHFCVCQRHSPGQQKTKDILDKSTFSAAFSVLLCASFKSPYFLCSQIITPFLTLMIYTNN